MTLEIITPEKIVFKEEVDEIIVPTITGVIGILPNHVPLVTQVAEGEIIVKKDAKLYSLAVTGGFLEVSKNHVSILTNFAIRAEDIEVAKVEEAKKRAEQISKEKATDKDFRIAQSELLKSIVQLRVATKYKRRRTNL